MNLLRDINLKVALQNEQKNNSEHMIEIIIDNEIEYTCRIFVNGNNEISYNVVVKQALYKSETDKTISFTKYQHNQMSIKEKMMVFHVLVNMSESTY